MAYATIADMIVAYDERVLKQLVQDDNTTNPDISTNTTILAMLDQATALIDASLRKTYRNDQLAALAAANSDTLLRLNVDLAIGLLIQRRTKALPAGIKEIVDDARDTLKQIRDGTIVLDDDEARTATIATTHRVTEEESRRNWPLTNSALYPGFRRERIFDQRNGVC